MLWCCFLLCFFFSFSSVIFIGGIELDSFIIPHMMLCFRRVKNSVNNTLIFQLLLNSADRNTVFSTSHDTPPVSKLGFHKQLGRTPLGQLVPADQRDGTYHLTSCSVIKSGGRRKRGTFGFTAFVFPSNVHV